MSATETALGRATFVLEAQAVFEPFLVRLVERAGLAVVGVGRAFDRRTLDQYDPDVVLVDVDYAEGGAPRAIRALRDGAPRARIIAVAQTVDAHFAARCYIAGANAVLAKCAEEEFVRRLTAVAAGDDDEVARALMEPASAPRVSAPAT